MSRAGDTGRAPFGYVRDAETPSDDHLMDCGVVDADGTGHVGGLSVDRVHQIQLLMAGALLRHRARSRQGGAS